MFDGRSGMTPAGGGLEGVVGYELCGSGNAAPDDGGIGTGIGIGIGIDVLCKTIEN